MLRLMVEVITNLKVYYTSPQHAKKLVYGMSITFHVTNFIYNIWHEQFLPYLLEDHLEKLTLTLN